VSPERGAPRPVGGLQNSTRHYISARKAEVKMFKRNIFLILMIAFWVSLFAGCAGPPVRQPVKVDTAVPVGTIEGNQFVGIRYPYTITTPPGWKISTEYPKFMIDLGYDKEGLDESQLFLFNPATRSNVQIDFSPAAARAVFDQRIIENLTTMATGSFTEELQKDYGKDVKVEISPTVPILLKGVPYAAKKFATYEIKGVKREQGWIYAFAEPYQIFILYMILGKEESNDRRDLEQILNSFALSGKQ
jgi:hypothetical protein